MALLTTCLNSRSVPGVETNLVTGRVYVYAETTMNGTPLHCGFCWRSPGTGTAKIEIWGAGGSGARMCCCGYGIPGNAGAYSQRTITVTSGCYVCGCVGISCGNSSSLCNRGQSAPTMLCWFGNGTNGCMCAQGGWGGYSYCSTSPSAWCCFLGGGFSGCCIGPSCGIICNTINGAACAFGGTVNCCGPFSCTLFTACNVPASASCCNVNFVAAPAYSFGVCGGLSISANECDSEMSMASGQGFYQFNNAMVGLSRHPTMAAPTMFCWNGARSCGCYEMQGCNPMVPYGMGGLGAVPCGETRDHGWRGGMGLVRITYSGTGI